MTSKAQSPAQELAERAAESIPSLQAAAAAVGLQDHQRMLRDHARRVRDSHRVGARAAGMDDIAAEPTGDDMGDIIISGDITNTYLPPPLAAQTSQPTAAPASNSAPAAPGLSNWTKAALVAASLASGGVGAAIPLLTNLLSNKPAPPPATQPLKLQGYEIRLVPDKAERGVGSGG